MEENIIEIIYKSEEEKLDRKIKQINKNIKEKIRDINVNKLLENISKTNELKKVLEQIEENYNVKISEYNKEFYKQGFIDGVNLIINCLK